MLPIWFRHSHSIASSYCAFCSKSIQCEIRVSILGSLGKVDLLVSHLWKSDVGEDIISCRGALNSLLRLVYTAQSFHIKRKIFCCRLTSRLHDNLHSLNVFGSSLETVKKPNLSRSKPSQKKRREPESGMAHFPCCVCTRVACTSGRSTNSDGLVFPLFVLWVCAYDFEKFSEVPSSKSRCVAPIKHKRSGASSLGTTFTHLSTQIANQQHKALRHADDSLMFKASVQENIQRAAAMWRKMPWWLSEVRGQDRARSAEQHLWVPGVPEKRACERPHSPQGPATIWFVWEKKETASCGHSCRSESRSVQLFPSKRDLKVSVIYSLSSVVRGWHFLSDKTHQRQDSCLPLCLFTGCRQTGTTAVQRFSFTRGQPFQIVGLLNVGK